MTAEDRDDADDEKWCAERRTEVIDYLARQPTPSRSSRDNGRRSGSRSSLIVDGL